MNIVGTSITLQCRGYRFDPWSWKIPHAMEQLSLFATTTKPECLVSKLTHAEKRLPEWCSGKESACQCKRRRRCEFNPWVGKIPWSRKWQPTPVFLPGKFHAQRRLAGCRPWGRREPDTAEQTHSMQPDARHAEGAAQLPAGSQQSPPRPGRARQGKEALFFLQR